MAYLNTRETAGFKESRKMIRRFFMFIIPGLLDRIEGTLPRNVLLCLTVSVLASTSAWGGADRESHGHNYRCRNR